MVNASLSCNMIPERQSDFIHPDDFVTGFADTSFSGVTNNADLWDGPTDIQPEPDTGGHTIFVKSDDVADTLLGTGARTVDIHYLDTAGVPQSVSADLNGTTEVDTGVTDCMFVQQHHVTAVGSNLVSVGNIDTLIGTGGAVSSRIKAAGNQSMTTMFQVPTRKKLIITGWYGGAVAATTKIANLRLRSSNHELTSLPGVYHFRGNLRAKDSTTPWVPLSIAVPALAVVKISAWTDGSISAFARWNGYLERV